MSFQSACYFPTSGEMGKPLQSTAIASAAAYLGDSDRTLTISDPGVYQLSTLTELDIWGNNGSANFDADGACYRVSFNKFNADGTLYEFAFFNVVSVRSDKGAQPLVGSKSNPDSSDLHVFYSGSFGQTLIVDQPMVITLNQNAYDVCTINLGVDASIQVELMAVKLC